MLKRIICFITIFLITAAVMPIASADTTVDYGKLLLNYGNSELITYDEYINSEEKSDVIENFDLQFNANTQEYLVSSKECEFSDGGIISGENSAINWKINVEKSGYYQIGFTYIPSADGKNEIIRQIKINGKCPFRESERITFSRCWTDSGKITADLQGNDVLPEQIQLETERFEWADGNDSYYSAPFRYYLTKGENKVSLISVSEKMTLKSVRITSISSACSYQTAIDNYKKEGLEEEQDFSVTIQAETPDLKSSSTLSAVSDRTSPLLQDHNGDKTESVATKLNIIGGGRTAASGMWTEYVIDDVPADGLYKLVFKAKQDDASGTTVARKIYVNGKVPFAQAENFEFSYSSGYKNIIFGDENGAYLIPLKKGKNTFRVETTLGAVAEYCIDLEKELEVLNGIYRKFVVVMGTDPDVNRDYDIAEKLPNEVEMLSEESKNLYEISSDLKKKFGNSNYTSTINTIVLQLKRMAENPYIIPSNLTSFNSNISSLGSVVTGLQETELDIDYIIITSDTESLPRAEANFFENASFTVKNLLYSFSNDYNSIGADGEYNRSVEAWFLGGREQAQVLKNLITTGYSKEYGVNAVLKLVSDTKTLLQATLANRGPDIALGVGSTDSMNFAFRGALADISKFEDYADVASAFSDAALTTLSHEDRVYGLPQTMTYPVMFYRADILNDLDISVPKTWDDVYGILPILSQNNMSFGLPISNISEASNAGVASFGALLYQQGGSYYTDDLKKANFYNEKTIQVMRQWVKLYTSYGLPISYNFVNRFAAGSMPIAVADFSQYNTLCLYAPQLEGKWSFTVIPGTRQADGSVDHRVPVTIKAAIVFNTAENLNDSWNFIKWWTNSSTQSKYGTQLENLLGKGGRYDTANIEALGNLPWDKRLYDNLLAQLDFTIGVPEVPGGYYTWRYLDNAFKEIYNEGTDARETMYEYDITVNKELEYQRQALGIK